jgi:cytochrome c oxidase subunit 2
MSAKTWAALAAAAWLAACGRGPDSTDAGVIRIEAKKFSYNPDTITLKRGRPATLELVSLDRKHGFTVPDLGIRADVLPDKPVRITLTPQNSGTFPFHCDLFCGSGHEGMNGKIVVTD